MEKIAATTFSKVCLQIRDFCTLLLSLSAVTTGFVIIGWAAYGTPQVESMIRERLSPIEIRMSQIESALDMNDAQHKAMMTEEQAKIADAIYTRSCKLRGRP